MKLTNLLFNLANNALTVKLFLLLLLYFVLV